MKNIILAAFAALVLAAMPAWAGSPPRSYLDQCQGNPLAIHVSGWTYDPDAPSQYSGVIVRVFTDSACTQQYGSSSMGFILAAALPRADVNQALGIVGDHGFDADITVPAGTYWVQVYAVDTTNDGFPQIGSTRCVTVTERGKVRLWAGGPYWAKENIGADEPWDYGWYFWWGDTVGYRRAGEAWVASDGSSPNFSFDSANTLTYGKTYATLQSEGWITADGVLVPVNDAAHVKWGGSWRMPTAQELSALNDNCDWTWTTTNGVSGYVVRGRGAYASASIFLPAGGQAKKSSFIRGLYTTSSSGTSSSGFFLSSVPVANTAANTSNAQSLFITSFTHETPPHPSHYNASFPRDYGHTIRPVQTPTGMIVVSFNANGGSASLTSESYVPGQAYGFLPTATREDHMFAGWFTAAGGGTQVTTSSSVPASATTLYAHWTEIFTPLPGSGTAADPYRISSVADWDIFATNVGAGFDTDSCYRLDADIGPVTNTVGTSEYPFAGVFDGGSNTLTLALSGTDSFLAPFSTIGGATISNLVVDGTVAGNMHCSGLVGRIVDGTNVIENCEVAAAITSSGSHFGGVIGHSITYAATLRGCVFSGSLSGGTYVATFHGWSDGGATTTLIDCLDASESDQPIGRGTDAACVSNTYYLTNKNFSNGERLWSEGRRGKRAYSVTGGEGVDPGFGKPAATYAAAGLVAYPTGLAYNGTFYAGQGDTVRLDLAATPPSGMVLGAYVTSDGTLSRSGSTWTLAMPNGPVVVSANWTPDITHNKVQLWKDGPYWAEMNVGANEPWESGLYFWWGDTVGYKWKNNAWAASDGSTSDFSFEEGNAPTYGKDHDTLQSEGWITDDDSSYVLAPAHDAARAHWGGDWRMPTYYELAELRVSCDWTWTTTNGVSGYVVRGQGEYSAASIFLPAAGSGSLTDRQDAGRKGNYWSSLPANYSLSDANDLGFDSSGYISIYYYNRYYGHSVRPVQSAPTAYDIWAAANGVAGAWDATDANGVHNIFRYAFDKPTGTFTNPPLLSITFDGGQPIVLTPPLVNTNGYTFGLLAYDALTNANPSAFWLLSPDGTNAVPGNLPARFFRLGAAEGNIDDK